MNTQWTPIMIITPLLSALFAIFFKTIMDAVLDRRKKAKIKALLVFEIEENYVHVDEVISALKFMEDISVSERTNEELESIYNKEGIRETFHQFVLDAERHLGQISLIIYKDIFLKTSDNFNKENDSLIHEIYFNLIKIEKYHKLIKSRKEESLEKTILILYLKILILARKVEEKSIKFIEVYKKE